VSGARIAQGTEERGAAGSGQLAAGRRRQERKDAEAERRSGEEAIREMKNVKPTTVNGIWE
jgi:hypothetical protein